MATPQISDKVTADLSAQAEREAAAPEQPIRRPPPTLLPPLPRTPAPPVGYPPYPPPAAPVPQGQPRRSTPFYIWVLGGFLGLVAIGGLVLAVFFGLVAAGVIGLLVAPEASQTQTRVFTVSDPPSLTVQNTTGSIQVVPGADGQITVQVTKRARDVSTSAAQNDLDAMTITMTQNANTLNIDARTNVTGLIKQLKADLVITVPAAANLHLEEVTGTITVNGTTGTLSAHLSTGNIEVHRVTLTGNAQLSTTTGNLTFDGALTNGASLTATVTTGTASLTLPSATSAHLDASVNVGAISLTGWPIVVQRHGTGASAAGDLNPNPSGMLTVRVTTGDIHLTAR